MELLLCAVKYVNGGTGICVVRSSRKQYRTIWAAITFVTEIRKLPLVFNLLDLSGETPNKIAPPLSCKMRYVEIC